MGVREGCCKGVALKGCWAEGEGEGEADGGWVGVRWGVLWAVVL